LPGGKGKGDILESYFAAERLLDLVNLYQGGGLLNSILGNRSDRFVSLWRSPSGIVRVYRAQAPVQPC
jgi:hypothetical protein